MPKGRDWKTKSTRKSNKVNEFGVCRVNLTIGGGHPDIPHIAPLVHTSSAFVMDFYFRNFHHFVNSYSF